MGRSILRLHAFALLLTVLAFLSAAAADTPPGYVLGTIDGKEYLVQEGRRPSLYTQNYGDCMGGSAIDVTRFDAAYYKDNMTVVFHLGGETTLLNETIMMFIGVYAYGEARFDLIFNPCSANIESACPLQAGVPVEASGIIPISLQDVSGIPPLALAIPDFEGQAILRIFSNSTQSEIGCYTAVVTNGNSFSQQAYISSMLGLFTFVALISSFATAVYGDSVAEMRKHYAHSISVLVVFAVWQHIYFSGALSMNWPSVLVAFWSNYAWAGGIIYSDAMQNTISNFIGANKGNTTALGAAGNGVANPDLGGGYDVNQIYRRALDGTQYNTATTHLQENVAKRALVDSSGGFSWYGNAVKPGVPLPGNFSGFAGTLAPDNIPASNAFMTGFLWFLILLASVAMSVLLFKLVLEGLSRMRLLKQHRLRYFRAHFMGYTALAMLRTLFIGFFMLMFLSLFQFSYLASPAPVAIAAVVFLVMLIGIGGLAGYACFYRIRHCDHVSEPDRLHIVKRKLFRVIPCYGFERNSRFPQAQDKQYAGSLPWWSVRTALNEKTIHDDEDFIKKFGWLASRFRRTRWWFFSVWLVYEFVRACFLAGASSQPLVQVFGLLAVEVIAFVCLIIMRPFEGQRLNMIVVYALGFSKVTTVGLSAAFLVRFNISRILATVIGIVIIVIQGILTIVVLIAIIVGASTSYMSVMRTRETIHPSRWIPVRKKYFERMDFKASDIKQPEPLSPEPERLLPESPKEPYFSVSSVRRMAKVEDEDSEFMSEITGDYSSSQMSLSQSREALGAVGNPIGHNRAPSVLSQTSYSSLPYGARVHRASWSTHDFNEQSAAYGHRRAMSNPFSTPDSGSRPPSKLVLSTSSEDASKGPSPLSTNGSVTPIMSPTIASLKASTSPIQRPRSWSSSRPGSRPKLHTLVSQDDIPPLPTAQNSKDTRTPGTAL